MGKLILEVLLFMVIVGVFAMTCSYLTYFWMNKRRVWKKEDELFNERKKEEALQELIQTQNLLNDAKSTYYVDWEKINNLKGDKVEETK